MRLHLFRHAAARRARQDEPDSERPLTGRGARRFARAVHGLSRSGVVLDALYTSPWRRARETAELLRPLVAGPLLELELLAAPPGAPLLRALRALEDEHPSVALVGHQPWLGELLALLAIGASARGPSFLFSRGGQAVLEGSPGRGTMCLRSLSRLRDMER